MNHRAAARSSACSTPASKRRTEEVPFHKPVFVARHQKRDFRSLITEFSIALSPVQFGSGIRLFDGMDAGRMALEPFRAETTAADTPDLRCPGAFAIRPKALPQQFPQPRPTTWDIQLGASAQGVALVTGAPKRQRRLLAGEPWTSVCIPIPRTKAVARPKRAQEMSSEPATPRVPSHLMP
jgi:hypothetical protein